ncbi:transmembrane protein, putative (macronuclear) [Tetrahymena thermophila SB210]|uniref:Transmembrane protein, putative n=1 Tax=Tetrahymena thermophila (strain SB210) TaxID=312017 RepID=Q239T4_TETTS|nr:transmembrane protein, putative [Tetrahymena thermophila SB210]EAR93324.2 transmembrane protein, putative [Tetrahymena thermophila SB210]|eukprot:XP_001013569.2 transmembrane protein, putative [Tetrahymena thermophila SB210]
MKIIILPQQNFQLTKHIKDIFFASQARKKHMYGITNNNCKNNIYFYPQSKLKSQRQSKIIYLFLVLFKQIYFILTLPSSFLLLLRKILLKIKQQTFFLFQTRQQQFFSLINLNYSQFKEKMSTQFPSRIILILKLQIIISILQAIKLKQQECIKTEFLKIITIQILFLMIKYQNALFQYRILIQHKSSKIQIQFIQNKFKLSQQMESHQSTYKIIKVMSIYKLQVLTYKKQSNTLLNIKIDNLWFLHIIFRIVLYFSQMILFKAQVYRSFSLLTLIQIFKTIQIQISILIRIQIPNKLFFRILQQVFNVLVIIKQYFQTFKILFFKILKYLSKTLENVQVTSTKQTLYSFLIIYHKFQFTTQKY